MSEAPENIVAFMGGRWKEVLTPEHGNVPHARYVRGDIADEHKRQRDRLLAACELVEPLVRKVGGLPGIYEELKEIRAAVAACEQPEPPEPTHWQPIPEPPPQARTENGIPRTSVPAAPHPPKNDLESGT